SGRLRKRMSYEPACPAQDSERRNAMLLRRRRRFPLLLRPSLAQTNRSFHLKFLFDFGSSHLNRFLILLLLSSANRYIVYIFLKTNAVQLIENDKSTASRLQP